MADVATLNQGFLEDLGNAEFYLSMVTPPIRMTNRLFKDYQNILNQILIPLLDANRALVQIRDPEDPTQSLTSDDLRSLQDQHAEACRKYEDMFQDVYGIVTLSLNRRPKQHQARATDRANMDPLTQGDNPTPPPITNMASAEEQPLEIPTDGGDGEPVMPKKERKPHIKGITFRDFDVSREY